jgi:sugar phosphate isomerase/epimerase
MKIGLQLFSVKEHLEKNPRTTLKRVAELGYNYLELFAFPDKADEKTFGLNMTFEEAKSFLSDSGLKVVSGHYYWPGNESLDAFFEYMAGLGSNFIGAGMARFPGGRPDVLDICKKLNQDANIAKKYGLKFFYHNHYYEYQPFDDEMVIDIIMNNTDPGLVNYEMDAFWAARGGVDPVKEMERIGKRIILLHQKDFSKTAGEPLNIWEKTVDINTPVSKEIDMPTRRVEIFAEVGTGILPIQANIDAGNKIGVEYMFLEQDKTKIGELESIEMSMKAFRKFHGITWE